MKAKQGITAVIVAFATTVALAANITVDRVAQRWPWNNKIDMYYTVHGGQNVVGGTFARIEFTANIGGTEMTIDGNAIGASASDGEHVATWTAPAGLRASGCTMTARLIASDVPSGDDYMIVDLATGSVTYEGLLASQGDSNDRYRADPAYKTSRLVLRKVPRWADRTSLPNAASLPSRGYPTGDSTNYEAQNGATNWVTKCAYYIGIFELTQGQYKIITGGNPSSNDHNKDSDVDLADHRPVDRVRWYDLRRPSGDSSDFSAIAKVPSVSSDTGTFFQRLNYKTGLYFDLPTEVMWEIAARAGVATTYIWSSNTFTDHVVNQAINTTRAAGSKKANDWGIYDMFGNINELCLDGYPGLANLANAKNPFVPSWDPSDTARRMRGGQYSNLAEANFRASARNAIGPDVQNAAVGFRVAIVAD